MIKKAVLLAVVMVAGLVSLGEANGYQPGDVDGDGYVGVSDLAAVAGMWRHSAEPFPHWADYTSGNYAVPDGLVSVADIMWVAKGLGERHFVKIAQGKMSHGGNDWNFVSKELGTSWGHNFWPVVSEGWKRQVFKLSFVYIDWDDPGSGVCISPGGVRECIKTEGSGYLLKDVPECRGDDPAQWDERCLNKIAFEHPNQWWILGEEVNFWFEDCLDDGGFGNDENGNPLVCGKSSEPDKFFPSPPVFARWYKDVTDSIQDGWDKAEAHGHVNDVARGKFIGFYFVQDDIGMTGGSYKCGADGAPHGTADYLDKFYAEWICADGSPCAAAGKHDSYGVVPMDGVDFNYRPKCNIQEGNGGGINRTVNYWCGSDWTTHTCDGGKRAELDSRSWLGESTLLWGETQGGRNYTSDKFPQNPQWGADQCDVATRLDKLMAWGNRTVGFDALLWYAIITDLNQVNSIRHSSLYEIPDTEWSRAPNSPAWDVDITDTCDGGPCRLTVVGETFAKGSLIESCQ